MVIVTLTTDVGWKYAAEMKGRILSINPDATIVDVSHHILPQKIMQGAFVMYSVAPHFTDAVHVGVVDPGVGTERKPIIIECEHAHFVGPDNGLLIPAAKTLGIKKVYEITPDAGASSVFHGRDVFAPAAARLSKGERAAKLGEEIEEYVDLDFGECEVTEGRVRGRVLFIDRFGNIVTNIRAEHVRADAFEVKMGIVERKVKVYPSYGFAEQGEILALIGSSGFLEIAQRGGNAAALCRAEENMEIEIFF